MEWLLLSLGDAFKFKFVLSLQAIISRNILYGQGV
jgi:hypothetical protein